MSSDNQHRGKKRSKAFYRKSAFGAKRQKTSGNVLQAGIRGFLVMCNSNESSAVREAYNILNEYGDLVFGLYKPPLPSSCGPKKDEQLQDEDSDEDEDDCDDVEKALKKEVASIKSVAATERRFQNVATKAKNCVFIRTTVDDPVKLVTTVMEDIATRKLKRARYAARMLPIVGTCKAQTAAISELAKETLQPYLGPDIGENPPKSFTIIFKARNNNGTACGKESVISNVKKIGLEINPKLIFSWSDYELAVLIEIVCNVCCLGVAPGFHRLRKYNFQELSQGARLPTHSDEPMKKKADDNKQNNAFSLNASVKESGDDTESEIKPPTDETDGKDQTNKDLDKSKAVLTSEIECLNAENNEAPGVDCTLENSTSEANERANCDDDENGGGDI